MTCTVRPCVIVYPATLCVVFHIPTCVTVPSTWCVAHVMSLLCTWLTMQATTLCISAYCLRIYTTILCIVHTKCSSHRYTVHSRGVLGLALLYVAASRADGALKKIDYKKKRAFPVYTLKSLMDRTVIFSIYMVFLPSL